MQKWRLVIDAAGEEPGRERVELGEREPAISALRQPHREGSWMLSLGIEVEGEMLDLVPLLADLIKRDARWAAMRIAR